MNRLIVQAIREKRRLRLFYDGRRRLVEPQCYGRGRRGTELLRVYQLEGGTPPERLFDVLKISQLTLLDERFDAPGPHYRRNDSAMCEIFCEL